MVALWSNCFLNLTSNYRIVGFNSFNMTPGFSKQVGNIPEESSVLKAIIMSSELRKEYSYVAIYIPSKHLHFGLCIKPIISGSKRLEWTLLLSNLKINFDFPKCYNFK